MAPTDDEVRIVEYRTSWPTEFRRIGEDVRSALGNLVARIDHIGSTAVPGLSAKDVIDVQVSVTDEARLDETAQLLGRAGWTPRRGIHDDHLVPGWPPDGGGPKALMREPAGGRRVNVHIRTLGRPNQRYPLVVRDYLRAHPESARAYATLKLDLAELTRGDEDRYTDVKDAACDLINLAAEEWAETTGWAPGRSDA